MSPREESYADFLAPQGNRCLSLSFWLSRRSAQRCRRRFSEQRAVGNRKAAQFPEPVIGGDLGDSRAFRVRTPQCPPYQMHPPQPEIPLWAHAKVIQATVAQCPIRRADFCSEVRHV